MPVGALLLIAIISLHYGGSELGLTALYELLVTRLSGDVRTDASSLAAVIFFDIRIPRTLIAALCGGALAGAGVVSQGLFRNALASPAILGTSTGGSFCVALAFYLSPVIYHWYVLPASAFTGALLVTALVILLTQRGLIVTTDRLLLAGFAVNAFFGALTSFVIFLLIEEHHRVGSILHWLFGGFDGKMWYHVQSIAPIFLVGTAICYRICNQLDILCLTEDVARSLSVDINKLRRTAITAIALLIGGTIAVAGALPFIGLMIPHVCRLIYGANHKILLTKSIIHGMSFTLLMDLLTRLIGGTREIDVGIITAMIGGPFFLVMLLWQK